MAAWIASAGVSLALGLALKALDEKRRGEQAINPKRLTLLQVVYLLLLTYPFGLAYIYVDQLL